MYIAADMEGTAGYVAWPERWPEEEWFREQVTREVNAAIEGALAGGASRVIVSDIHWRKQNIIPDKLAGNASLVRGTRRRLLWMDCVEKSDLVFLIGFHSRYGIADAILPHTIDKRIINMKINNINADEAMISAITAGYYRVPVGLATGDKSFAREVKVLLPQIETVISKEAVGSCAALCIHPEQLLSEIRTAARIATARGINGEYKPCQIGNEVMLHMELNWPVYADALELVQGVVREDDRKVSFAGDWLRVMALLSLFVNWVADMPNMV